MRNSSEITINMNRFIILLFVILLIPSCNSKPTAEQKTEIEQTIRLKIIDSFQNIIRIDSIGNANSVSILTDSLIFVDSLRKLSLKIEIPLSELYDSLKSTVVTVTGKTDEGSVTGTGFFISPNGILVTNEHVLNNVSQGFVETANGRKYQITKIIDRDEFYDWAIFKVDTESDIMDVVNISEQRPNIGDKCFAIGSPMRLKLTMSEGIISGLRDDGKIIQTTTQITYGSSGGPLFNSKGQLIGITTAMLASNADLNFAISINLLKNKINENR